MGTQEYMKRYLMYGLVLVVSQLMELPILAVLVGLMCNKGAILLYALKERRISMSDVSAIIIHIGKFSLQIQQSILVWLGICVFFAFFFYFAGKKIEAQDPSKSSKGIVYICEEMYNLVLYVIKDNLRETTKKYIPLFGTLIVMMIVSNLIGLIGLQNPTSNVSFNATLAVTMWLMIQGNGIKKVDY